MRTIECARYDTAEEADEILLLFTLAAIRRRKE